MIEMMWGPPLVVLASAALCATAKSSVGALLDARRELRQLHNEVQPPLVCVVVRTYWRHGPKYGDGLQRLIDTLRWQEHERWVAKLVVKDSTPFADLADILQAYNDPRISLYASWIGKEYKPKKPDGTWTQDYHKNLYALTDEAARACPLDTEWVVFTNGDNAYHKGAFASLRDQADADAVAWDFYSRYHRPTGIPCERFQAEEGAPACKVNRMKWCHTDLGAVAYRWELLLQQDLRFGNLEAKFTGEDAAMAEQLVRKNWRITHLEGRCLFDQGPNPQMCARLGGVWDERRSNMPDDFGGHCASIAEATAVNHDPSVELLNITLTHDGGLAGFEKDVEPATAILCMRPSENYRYMMIPPFKAACAEDIDKPLLEEHRHSLPVLSWVRTCLHILKPCVSARLHAALRTRVDPKLQSLPMPPIIVSTQ